MSQGQTDYTGPKGRIAGKLQANGVKHDATGVNAEASAAMRFGIFVKHKSGTEQGLELLDSVNDKPMGVTGFHHTYDRDKELDATTGGVVPGVELAVRQFGIVSVRCEGTVNPYDRAHVRAVAGVGGTVLGAARAGAVSLETIDYTNCGFFVSSKNDDGFADFFVCAFPALTVPEAESVLASMLAPSLAAQGHGVPSFTIGAESTNDRLVTVQFNGLDGNAMAIPIGALCWLSDTDVDTLGTAADTIVVTTGQSLQVITAALKLWALSNAAGVLALTITKSGTSNRFLNVLVGGLLYRSAVIGFTT